MNYSLTLFLEYGGFGKFTDQADTNLRVWILYFQIKTNREAENEIQTLLYECQSLSDQQISVFSFQILSNIFLLECGWLFEFTWRNWCRYFST